MTSTSPSRPSDTDALLSFADRLADISGEVIMPYFREAIGVEDKVAREDFDPVTIADRNAEEAMRREIGTAYPDHGIIGEEFGNTPGDRYSWVLDPIDGTRSFISGIPLWGTLIGLLDGDRPVAGIMNQPFTGERFRGSANGAVLEHGGRSRTLSTRSTTALEEAHMLSTNPHMFRAGAEADAFHALRGRAQMTRYGSDCYGYCMLAAGHVDLVVESGLEAYDIVALIPVIEGAGGIVTTWSGASAASGGQIVAACNAELHQKALEVLSAGC